MKRAMTLAVIGITLATNSACKPHEPPRTVSDCVSFKRISAEPHPVAPDADDPGNAFDTETTFNEVLAHNEVYDRLCG